MCLLSLPAARLLPHRSFAQAHDLTVDCPLLWFIKSTFLFYLTPFVLVAHPIKFVRLFQPDALQSRQRRFPRPTHPLHSCLCREPVMYPFPSQITHFHDPMPPHVSHGCGFVPLNRASAPPPNVNPARTAAPNPTWSTIRCARCILPLLSSLRSLARVSQFCTASPVGPLSIKSSHYFCAVCCMWPIYSC